jgi:hypothetical protein
MHGLVRFLKAGLLFFRHRRPFSFCGRQDYSGSPVITTADNITAHSLPIRRPAQ